MTENGYEILGAAASQQRESDGTVARATPKSDAEARAMALDYLKSLISTPYIWGGKDPSKGLDCSGAVTVAYEYAGLAKPRSRYRYGSADLFSKLQPTTSPQPGDLAFYGPGKVNHVMMVAEDGKVIGATGGGSKTKTVDDAMKIGAYVKFKPWNYRKDFMGYRSAPSVYGSLEGQATTVLNTSDSREDRRGTLATALALFGAIGAVGVWLWIRSDQP